MSNAKQRNKNRRTARTLNHSVRYAKHVCENCGELGAHWVSTEGTNLFGLLSSDVDKQQGFWTCSKMYGPDGRRLPEGG